jgi:hypothetical protein
MLHCWCQTKLNIRRISYFLRKLPAASGVVAQKTRVTCPNGAVIEAFPNNPDTIRVPTLNVVWWDETNFTPNDGDLYDAILFTLGTTDGKLVCTSTPWNTIAYSGTNLCTISKSVQPHNQTATTRETYKTEAKIQEDLDERMRRVWKYRVAVVLFLLAMLLGGSATISVTVMEITFALILAFVAAILILFAIGSRLKKKKETHD